MKHTLIIISMLFWTGICSGQETKKEEHQKGEPTYCCVKMDYCGGKAKKCPKCEQPLIKDGLYYCPKCYHKSKNSGMCGKCNLALVKMEKKV